MPNKKKKEPKNPYYFFMIKFRKEEEMKGRRFTGMAEVANCASSRWKEMTAAQKAPFEELARKAKIQDKNNLDNKYTSQGISFAQLQREEQERREKEQRMIKDIQSIRDVASDTLLWHPFYFAHVNYYCYCQTDGNYYPCEIAIARFTLRKGIDDTMHSLIELDQLPSGYCYEATKFSQETHEIPLPPRNGGERDYYKLSRNIYSFLMEGQDDSTLPPLYTLPVHIDPVANVLGFLDSSVHDAGTGSKRFRVYPITKLFFELRNACARCKSGPDEEKGFPVEALAERELDKDMFNFTTGISCSFHENKDSVQYCSLSIVKRWCFLISDHCCQDVGVALIPGSHVPVHSDTSKRTIPERESPDNRAAGAVGNGAIPKQPMPVTIIDHSKASQSDKDVRFYNVSGAGDVPIRNKAPAPPPLRQPNTMPQAIAGVLRKEPIFTPEDFPAIGGGGIFGKIPMAVAGRGRGNPPERKENQIPGAGRGRGLAESLASLNINGDR